VDRLLTGENTKKWEGYVEMIDNDLIKALRCLASQDNEGDCYGEHHNFMHVDGDENEIYCGSEPRDGRIQCPHYQNKYGVCFEDGECSEWLETVADELESSAKPKWIPAKEPPKNDKYILLSFENFSVPQVGRYEEDEGGGAYHLGDEEKSCISQELIVNAWMPLPKAYRADEEKILEYGQSNEKAGSVSRNAKTAADIDQAIEYFKDEISQMDVFSDIVHFRKEERKSIETALKVLQKAQEESQKGQQDGSSQCATPHG